MKRKIKKMIFLNSGIVIANLLAFTSFGLNLKLGSFLGILTILISVIVFFSGNKKILNNTSQKNKEKKETKQVNDLQTDEDFKIELVKCMSKREFRIPVENAVKQLERMRKKINILEEVLSQHFEKGSITYEKFYTTIANIEELFFDNLRKMILKITIFDQDEFNNMARDNRNLSTAAVSQRNAIYKEYVNYANLILEKNENILIKLDNLLLEVSKLDDVEESNIENLSAVQEVNDLIEQTKYYKQAGM